MCSTCFFTSFYSEMEPDDGETDLPAILQIQMNYSQT